jgi:hypothetical protein
MEFKANTAINTLEEKKSIRVLPTISTESIHQMKYMEGYWFSV